MTFLTVLIYFILSLMAGLVLIGISLDLIVINTIAQYLEKNILSDIWSRLILFLSGLIIILLCARYVQAIFRSSQRNKAITFESPEGKVSITIFALEDMLKKIAEARKEISRIKIKVFLKKAAIEVIIKGVLTAEANLVEFTKEMQEKVKEKLHNLLGEDKEVKVDLEIRKVLFDDKEGLSEEKEPEIPFRNYE